MVRSEPRLSHNNNAAPLCGLHPVPHVVPTAICGHYWHRQPFVRGNQHHLRSLLGTPIALGITWLAEHSAHFSQQSVSSNTCIKKPLQLRNTTSHTIAHTSYFTDAWNTVMVLWYIQHASEMKIGHRGPKICILATQKKLKKATDNLVVMLSQNHKPIEDGKSDFFISLVPILRWRC